MGFHVDHVRLVRALNAKHGAGKFRSRPYRGETRVISHREGREWWHGAYTDNQPEMAEFIAEWLPEERGVEPPLVWTVDE